MKKNVVESLSPEQLKAASERYALLQKVEASYDKTLTEIKAVCSKNGWESFPQFLDVYDTKTAPAKKEKVSRKRLTAEQKKEIVEKLKAGEGSNDLAKSYGTTYQTIRAIAKKNGLGAKKE